MSQSTATQNTPLLKSASSSAQEASGETPSSLVVYWKLHRLHKFPSGTVIVFWPCAWALAMSSFRTKQPLLEFGRDFALYFALCTLLHSAACVLSDLFDRKLDCQERTKTRPIASGAVSIRGAITCLLVETSILIGFLVYSQDLLVLAAGLFDLAILQLLYPLMKRVTYWPQAWLGLALGWGYVLVWLLHLGLQSIKVPITFLIGNICWAIVFDTFYGCQDRVDDAKIGVKSTALLFGDRIRAILPLFSAGFIIALSVGGYLNNQGIWYYLISVGLATLHLMWQLITFKENDADDCGNKFDSNGTLGCIVFIGLFIDYLKVII